MYIKPKAHKPDKNYLQVVLSAQVVRPIQRTCPYILTAHELKKVTLKYNLKDTEDLLRKIDKLNEEMPGCWRSMTKYYMFLLP